MIKRTTTLSLLAFVLTAIGFGNRGQAAEFLSGIEWDEPAVIDPGKPCGAPSDAVVLFDGTDMSQWTGAEK